MAIVSRRFENANGRRVEMVQADIGYWGPSCGARKPVSDGILGQRMTHFLIGLKLEDGRSIQVALSEKELEKINREAADYAKKFPWAEPAEEASK